MSEVNQAKAVLQRLVKQDWRGYFLTVALVLFGLFTLNISAYLNIRLHIGAWYYLLVLASVIFIVIWLLVSFFRYRRCFNLKNLAEHCNRKLPQLQESAHLLLASEDTLNPLQRIQRKRAAFILLDLEQSQGLNDVAPKFSFKLPVYLLIWALMLYPLSDALDYLEEQRKTQRDKAEARGPVQLTDMRISVSPPQYTGLPPVELGLADVSQNIEVAQGSQLRWQLKFNRTQGNFKLKIGEQILPLAFQAETGFFTAEAVVDKTTIYAITSEDKNLPGIYTLSVVKDKRPLVTIVEPKKTLVEVDKAGRTGFSIKARVIEDYGVVDSKILASVAKGSGEAVKFRDLEFEFDQKTYQDKQLWLSKQWDLKALGMEPGDEVYFSVLATDNKPGAGQVGRSSTVIVRWLEDEPEIIATEGISIPYQLEYFRSQRQIIMETEALIADKQQMTAARFNEVSVELGHAQGDLKRRYGQYLGDESSHEEAAFEANEDLAQAAEEHDHHDHDGHDHQTDDGQNYEVITSHEQMLEMFTHAHESIYIGEVSPQNPKAMMKKSVGFMWQAELHLLQGEPDKALPFEQKAYQYLKLAKQAERIYTKRLGFEPPPVTEERRLTGELDDISSFARSESIVQADPESDEVFRQAFTLINGHRAVNPLNEHQRRVLLQAQNHLTEMTEQRPILIQYVAWIEQMLSANSLKLDGCENCKVQLKQKLWQLIAGAGGIPVNGQGHYLNNDQALSQYVEQSSQGGVQ